MKPPSGNRTFDKLILAIGILVAILAGLNGSTVENSRMVSLYEVKVVTSEEISSKESCKFLKLRNNDKLVESLL
jgi:hypothetical protein